jgi:hypothetical protein
MFFGTASTFFILPPSAIVREDGTLVKVQPSTSVRQELHNFIQVLKDKRIILLLPMFFASNYFYAYQGAVNAFYFDGATRACLLLSSLNVFQTIHRHDSRSTECDVGGCGCHCWCSDDWLLRPRWHPLQTAYSRLPWPSLRHHSYDHYMVLRFGMAGHFRPYSTHQTPLYG